MTTHLEISHKICDVAALAQQLSTAHTTNSRIVLCHGVFDLLHVGHIKYLNQAKKLGDVLVVSLTADRYVNKGPNRPAFNEQLRAEQLAALECVDYVAINDAPSAVPVIETIKPSFYVKGQDYKERATTLTSNLEKEGSAVEKVGGEMVFVEEELYSSSSLINAYAPPFKKETMEYLRAFSKRYPVSYFEDYLGRMQDLRVLVVGEAIIDEYHYCETMGKAGKEPVLVSRSQSSEQFIGGSLAIANHLAGFCKNVGVLCSIGTQNSFEGLIRSNLKKNVHPSLVINEGRPTIHKKRYVESYSLQKLFEIYTMDDDEPGAGHDEALLMNLQALLPEYDVVITADYGHGMLCHEAVEQLCSNAQFLAVNTQANAGNRGFHTISRYPRAHYVSISEVELRLEMRKRGVAARELLDQLLARSSYQKFTVTRGRNGLLTYDDKLGYFECPAFTSSVVDSVGSGDAVLALTSPLAALNMHPEALAFVGNVAGSEAVKIVGHRSFIESKPFTKHITSLLK
jgi:rfaE bifunctional protein nucleotidyltransferase chain/domain